MDICELKQVNQIKEEVEKMTGYKVMREQFYFYGLCPDCQKEI